MSSVIRRAYIEITNVCNLSCSFCRKNHRPARFMSAEEFAFVLKQITPLTRYIYLHVQGEPLLHPEFRRIMELCAQENVKVALVSNATQLERFPDLFSFGALHRCSLSLQSLPFHKPGSEVTLLNTLLPMLENASASGRPYIELRFWRKDLNSDPAVSHCLDRLHQRYEFQPTKTPNSYRILPYVFVNFDHEFDWPDSSSQISETSGTCLGGRDQIAVLSDGSVVPCCLDAEGEIVLGNLFEKDLTEILASGRYQKMTEGFARHKLIEPLCQRCTYRRRFP